jgi:hypothetical protein
MRPDAAGLAAVFGKACRCHIAQPAIRPIVIIIHSPTRRQVSNLIDVHASICYRNLDRGSNQSNQTLGLAGLAS